MGLEDKGTYKNIRPYITLSLIQLYLALEDLRKCVVDIWDAARLFQQIEGDLSSGPLGFAHRGCARFARARPGRAVEAYLPIGNSCLAAFVPGRPRAIAGPVPGLAALVAPRRPGLAGLLVGPSRGPDCRRSHASDLLRNRQHHDHVPNGTLGRHATSHEWMEQRPRRHVGLPASDSTNLKKLVL